MNDEYYLSEEAVPNKADQTNANLLAPSSYRNSGLKGSSRRQSMAHPSSRGGKASHRSRRNSIVGSAMKIEQGESQLRASVNSK